MLFENMQNGSRGLAIGCLLISLPLFIGCPPEVPWRSLLYPEDWEPSAYCKELDRDNVEAMIIFASWARYNYHLEDAKLQRSILRSYNEWILDFASYAPKRIFPAPIFPALPLLRRILLGLFFRRPASFPPG